MLSALDQEKNKVKVDDAREHVASLQRSRTGFTIWRSNPSCGCWNCSGTGLRWRWTGRTRNAEKSAGEGSAERAWWRSQNIFRNNSLGHAQEGDQLWPGSPLLRLFDPSAMDVEVSVGEPDGAVLVPGAKATVHLDAFPDIQV